MGIGLVLMLYAAGLTIMACIGAAVFGIAAYVLTRKAARGRKRAVIAAMAFPFACLIFSGVWFVTYATINGTVFHRDPGIGDTWQTPLPNGYALNMIDTPDEGTVYNPATQPFKDGVFAQEDAIFGVRQLQVAGDLIFGGRDSKFEDHLGQDSTAVDSYFELNTNKGSHREFKTLDELRKAAAADGAALNLRDFASVFDDFRYTWFDTLASALAVSVPLAGFCVLVWWVWSVRRTKPGYGR